jgi:hypothetical protein
LVAQLHLLAQDKPHLRKLTPQVGVQKFKRNLQEKHKRYKGKCLTCKEQGKSHFAKRA